MAQMMGRTSMARKSESAILATSRKTSRAAICGMSVPLHFFLSRLESTYHDGRFFRFDALE